MITCYTKPSFSCEALGFNTYSGVGDVFTGVTAPSCFENEGEEFNCYMIGEEATCATFDLLDDQNFFETRSGSTFFIPPGSGYSNEGDSITCYENRDATCSDLGYLDNQNIYDTRTQLSPTVPAYGYLNDGAMITCYEETLYTCAVDGYFDAQNDTSTRTEFTFSVPAYGYSNEGEEITCYEDN